MVITEEERREAIKDFSFDVDLMHRRLDAGDDFQKTLQAHLFIDHILSAMLFEELKRPDCVALDRMTIASKADLAMAMGLLDDDLYRPFKRINRLRNAIAHKLDFVIDEDAAKEIRGLMPSPLRQLTEDMSIAKSNSKLGRVLKVFIVFLDMVRQKRAEYRKSEQQRRENFEQAVAEAKAIVAELDARDAESSSRGRAIDRLLGEARQKGKVQDVRSGTQLFGEDG